VSPTIFLNVLNCFIIIFVDCNTFSCFFFFVFFKMLYSGKIKSVKRNFVVVVLVCVIYNYFDMKSISQYVLHF
jgi:hypothetical protein